MTDKSPEPTQNTQPRGIDPETGKPLVIPVPKRKDFDTLMDRATKGPTRAPRSGKAPR